MKLPQIGFRIIKSAVAVFACFMVDFLRNGGIPFYSAIAAILCMQPDARNSFNVAANRTIGTLIGGVYGMLVLWLIQVTVLYDMKNLQYLVISLLLIPLMYITVLLKKTSTTYITCVVFLSVVVSHGLDIKPYLFAFNRIIDTLIGIFVSLGINVIPFLKNKNS